MAHSYVWLGVGIVAFYYWLKAVDFFPQRRQPEYAVPVREQNYD
jgi:hypothetical protein